MVKIISDSTCDLSPALCAQYGVEVLPLHIILGADDRLDGVDVTPDDIYRWSDENKSTPKTSTISVSEAKRAFRPHVENGDDILCFSVSSSLSATYQNLCLAAKALDHNRIRIIDSRNLSNGVGLMVLEAAQMAAQGCGLDEITAHINSLIPCVRISFVVDTLTYLHRGGRCSGITALAGSALRLHPCIAVTDGRLAPTTKYRGAMPRVIDKYMQDLLPALRQANPRRVFLVHSSSDEATLDSARAQLESLGLFEEIIIARAGSVISSHCGPGAFGVAYIAGSAAQ